MNGAPERSIADTREAINDSYVRLGLSRLRQEESAGDELQARGDRERKQETAARLRWPGIVTAIGNLTRRYNVGAGREVLTMIDDADGESRVLVVTIMAPGGHTLRVAVHGAELCVRPTPSTVGAADDGQRWTTFGATDETIAAYALQDWLTHL
jgi:hypothetical protein